MCIHFILGGFQVFCHKDLGQPRVRHICRCQNGEFQNIFHLMPWFRGRDGYFFAQTKPKSNIYYYTYVLWVNNWAICEYSGQHQKNNRYKTCRTTLDKTKLPIQCFLTVPPNSLLWNQGMSLAFFIKLTSAEAWAADRSPFQSVFKR